MQFVDTDIFIRYLTKDGPKKAEACYRLFERAKLNEMLMERQKIAELYSYDEDFDRIQDSSVDRIEP
jgi:predicted nucleic acid-binding protein